MAAIALWLLLISQSIVVATSTSYSYGRLPAKGQGLPASNSDSITYYSSDPIPYAASSSDSTPYHNNMVTPVINSPLDPSRAAAPPYQSAADYANNLSTEKTAYAPPSDPYGAATLRYESLAADSEYANYLPTKAAYALVPAAAPSSDIQWGAEALAMMQSWGLAAPVPAAAAAAPYGASEPVPAYPYYSSDSYETAPYYDYDDGRHEHGGYTPPAVSYNPVRYPITPGYQPPQKDYGIPTYEYGPSYSFYGRFDGLSPSSMNGPRDVWYQPSAIEYAPDYDYIDPYANPFWESQVPYCSYRQCSKMRCEQDCGAGYCERRDSDLGYKCTAFAVERTGRLTTPGFWPESHAKPFDNEPVLPSYDSNLGWVDYPSLPTSSQWDCTQDVGCDLRYCSDRCDAPCEQAYNIFDSWFCPAPIPFWLFT